MAADLIWKFYTVSVTIPPASFTDVTHGNEMPYQIFQIFYWMVYTFLRKVFEKVSVIIQKAFSNIWKDFRSFLTI